MSKKDYHKWHPSETLNAQGADGNSPKTAAATEVRGKKTKQKLPRHIVQFCVNQGALNVRILIFFFFKEENTALTKNVKLPGPGSARNPFNPHATPAAVM